MNMNTKCHFCGNKNFKEARVQYIYRHNNQFLIVNDVPCEQCEYCGEEYFEGKMLTQIEKEFLSNGWKKVTKSKDTRPHYGLK